MKKRLGTVFCIVTVLAYLLFAITSHDAYGLTLGVPDDSDIWSHLSDCVDDHDVNLMYDHTYAIFPNRFGRTVVIEHSSNLGNTLHRAIHEKCGRTILNIRSFSSLRIATHFDFLGAANGCTTIYQLVERAGTPSNPSGSTMDLCQWTTLDGYTYVVTVHPETGLISNVRIVPPEGYALLEDEEVQFQWQVRFVYLGVVAVLSVILVCLLVISKKIRKRSEKSKEVNSNA